MRNRALIAGCIVATIAFAAYSRTLLPGVDMGDTGAFQAAVLWPEISARQAYPLYYALAKPFVAALTPDLPARGLNLFSALCAAIAVGLLTGVVAVVTGSIAGGVVSGLLLAFSYTFWSQAVIAEVYALHLALVGCCLVALSAWWRHPTIPGLATFLGLYALGFGNHLSMILLFAPFAAFVLLAAPHARAMLRPRIVLLAIGIAVVGALQYLPLLLTVWTSIDAPERWSDRVAAFWFDVTKSDWRESMVLGVQNSQLPERLAMFAFDVRQQFGVVGVGLALAGLGCLWRISRPWAALVLLAYVVNTVFAITYNVGDAHVFFLPGHYFVAFAAGAAIAAIAHAAPRRQTIAAAAMAGALGYAVWRGYDTWPVVDRHADRRAEQLVTRMTAGLDDRTALLAESLNWQVENAFIYETRYRLRQVVWTRLSDVLLHFPLLVRDNHAGGRDVVLTAGAVPVVGGAFGSLLPVLPDPTVPVASLAGYAARARRGTAYALAVLTPSRDETLDEEALDEALKVLTGGRVRGRSGSAYEVIIGRVGEAPLLHRSTARPFREKLSLPEGTFEVRLDGWVPAETFRRAGFGHVLLDRRRVLAIERGVSLTMLDGSEAVYNAGIYALQPRFRVPAGGLPELALLH